MRQCYKIFVLIFLLLPFCLFAEEESKPGFLRNISTTVFQDYLSFYSPKNLKYLFGGVLIAGVLANTNADRNIQDWVQKSVRNSNTDQFSEVVKPIGNIYEPMSIYAGFTFLGALTKRTTLGALAHEFGSKALRAIFVGAPTVGMLQYALGASRPAEGGSEWRPFHDTNAVSGHAFVGAIPFLTISKMVEPEYLKMLLYISSAATGLSRINDNKHYFSQMAAGWWIAYLAFNRLDGKKKQNVELCPAFFRGGWKMQLCLSL